MICNDALDGKRDTTLPVVKKAIELSGANRDGNSLLCGLQILGRVGLGFSGSSVAEATFMVTTILTCIDSSLCVLP